MTDKSIVIDSRNYHMFFDDVVFDNGSYIAGQPIAYSLSMRNGKNEKNGYKLRVQISINQDGVKMLEAHLDYGATRHDFNPFTQKEFDKLAWDATSMLLAETQQHLINHFCFGGFLDPLTWADIDKLEKEARPMEYSIPPSDPSQ